jgi:hypothetical protein
VISKDAPSENNFTVEPIPEGRELQYASIANVTGNVLQGLTLEEVRRQDTDEADAEALAVSEFRTFDGLVITATATAVGDGEPWVGFSAGVDTDAEPTADAEAADDGSGGGDPAAEAEAINARLSGWRFRIPPYKYDQLTRRIEDLLRDPPDADE